MMSVNDDISGPSVTTEYRTTPSYDDVAELVELCHRGRLFDVQKWIDARRPLQLEEPSPRRKSALLAAIEAGNHSLVQVLLSGGYDPNLERNSPLTWALADRREDLVELLLTHGCDPHQVSRYELFNTYDRALIERFHGLGVDLSVGNELAGCLAHGAKNRPLYGFVKHAREHDPAIARQLQIALHTAIDDGKDAAIALCMWAGAEPRVHAPTLFSASLEDESEGEEGSFNGWTAIEHAAKSGNIALLKRLRPDAARDDLDALLNWIRDPDVLDYLCSLKLPSKPTAWLSWQIHWYTGFDSESWRLIKLLERAFRAGMRWTEASDDEIKSIRRRFLTLDSGRFQDALRVLCDGENCSTELLQRLTKSEAFRRRLRDEGYFPGEPSGSYLSPRGRRDALKRLGIVVPPKRR
jgi:ankyrin repeat protein